MKEIIMLLFSLSLCLISQAEAETSSLVGQYIKNRDEFIQRFEKNFPTESELSQANAELEKQLKIIIGRIKIDGTPMQEDSSTIYLIKGDVGFGQVDGLIKHANGEYIFVTTLELLHYYLKQNKELPQDLKLLSKSEEIYSRTLSADAAVSNFGEIPIKSTPNNTYVYAFLGLSAQDIGPFIPRDVFVFFMQGNHVFFVSSPVKQRIRQIPECKSEWDKFASKSSAALAKYHASGLNDEGAFNENIQYEKEGYKAYQSCFAKRANAQPFFTTLIDQVQTIVDRIQ
jgi:hypothetical protein